MRKNIKIFGLFLVLVLCLAPMGAMAMEIDLSVLEDTLAAVEEAETESAEPAEETKITAPEAAYESEILQVSEIHKAGTCGENLSWTLTTDGVLTISGSGKMYDYGMGTGELCPWFSSGYLIQSVVIQSGVTSIGECAFYRCDMTSISIPSTITDIGGSAFYDCEYLLSADIPYGVTEIGYSTFYDCRKLEQVTIPSTVTVIQPYAFYQCFALDGVNIPEKVSQIGYYAFYKCGRLTSIALPDAMT